MRNFEVGDVLQCIESDPCSYLVKGKSYTVTAVSIDRYDRHAVDLDGVPGGWFEGRFKLVEKLEAIDEKVEKGESLNRFMVGQLAKCVDADGHHDIAINRLYAIESVSGDYVKLKGIEGEYFAWRFELHGVANQGDQLPVVAGTNPKAALGSASLPMTMLSPLACAYGALGKMNGACKYGGANYIGTQVVLSIYLDAIRRHLDRFLLGEEVDPVDKVPHLGAIMANVDIIVSARAAGKLIDNRLRGDGQLAALDALKPLVQQLNDLYADRNPKHYYLPHVR